MSCSFSKRYTFDCDGSVSVPKHHSRYAGQTYYTSKGENASTITLPSDLYEDVPDRVSYRDHVTIELEVDGAPFERSVNRCSDSVTSLRASINGLTDNVGYLYDGVSGLTHRVQNLTEATVAAEVGVCNEKVKSADKIGNSLSKGFSKYIGYLIRERLTELETQIPSVASTFKSQSGNLAKRKDVLGRDYERISDRYSKLFVKLNDELKGRLLELDRPAFENCAQMQATIFTNPFSYVLGQSICAGAEQLQAADAVRVSKLKGTTAEAMQVVKDYVKVIKRLSASVSGVLSDRKVGKTQSLYMPVVRMESDDITTQAKGNVRTFMPQWFESARDMGFGNALSNTIAEKETEKKSQVELEIIDGCFKKRFSNWAETSNNGEAVNSRVTEKILALWERSKAEMYN
jgi:hypothetical protein